MKTKKISQPIASNYSRWSTIGGNKQRPRPKLSLWLTLDPDLSLLAHLFMEEVVPLEELALWAGLELSPPEALNLEQVLSVEVQLVEVVASPMAWPRTKVAYSEQVAQMPERHLAVLNLAATVLQLAPWELELEEVSEVE